MRVPPAVDRQMGADAPAGRGVVRRDLVPRLLAADQGRGRRRRGELELCPAVAPLRVDGPVVLRPHDPHRVEPGSRRGRARHGGRPVPAPPHRHLRRPGAGRVQRLSGRTQRAGPEELPRSGGWSLMAESSTRPARPAGRTVSAALTRYRVMAYVVGVLLLVLVLVAMPLKYFAAPPGPGAVVGTGHGFLYAVYLLSAFDLALRARWSAKGTVLVLLAGTVAFLPFGAERVVTRKTRAGERV